jgi:hypothetical protein
MLVWVNARYETPTNYCSGSKSLFIYRPIVYVRLHPRLGGRTEMTAPPPSPSSVQQAYSIDRFAMLFDIGRSKVYEEIRAGRLKTKKAGARTLITHEDALAWLAALPSR